MTDLSGSLRARLAALFVLVAIPGLALLLFQTLEQRDMAIRSVHTQAAEVADLLAAEQSHLLEHTHRYLERLAQLSEVQNLEDPACSRFLNRMLRLNGDYANLGAPRADGELLCNAFPLNKRVNVADRPYIRRALDHRTFSIGEFQLDRAAGVTSINFAYPVIDPDSDQLLGAAVAVVSLQWWSDRLAEAALPKNALAYITDAAGTVIAVYPADGHQLGVNITALNLGVRTPGPLLDRRSFQAKDDAGVSRLFVDRPLLETSTDNAITVTVGVPVGSTLAALEESFVFRLGLLMIVMLLTFAFAYYGLRVNLFQPLGALSRFTSRLEAGKQVDRFNPSGASELVDLGTRFLRMAGARLKAENRLKVSEANLISAQRIAHMGHWTLSPTELAPDYSEQALRIFEITPDHAAGNEAFLLAVHPDDRLRVAAAYRQLLENNRSYDLEHRLLMDDGRIKYVHQHGDRLRDDNGNLLFFIGTVADVTARKQAEDDLRESEERFRQLAENIKEVFWLTAWPDNQVIYVSPSFEKVWQKSPTEVYRDPMTWHSAIRPDDRARVERDSLSIDEAGGFDNEFLIRRPDGSERVIHNRGFPIRDENGATYRIAGIAEDITDRKNAELAVRDSEKKYRTLFEQIPQGVVLHDETGRILDANPAAEQILSRPREQLIGEYAAPQNWRIADEGGTTRAADDHPAIRALQDGIAKTNIVLEGVHPGTQGQIWIRLDVVPLFNPGESRPYGVFSSFSDITETRLAQMELERGARRLRAVFDQQFQSMAIIAPDGTTIDINDLPLQAQGLSRTDYVGKPFWDSPAWKDLPEWQTIIRKRLDRALDADGAIFTQDVYRAADGALREAAAVTSAVRDSDGKTEYLLMQASDNTEQRQAERERDRLLTDLRLLNEQLEQRVQDRTSELVVANQELESFTYAVSHDLRSPVRAISGFEAALREDFGDCLPAEGREFLDEIQIGAERMNALIEGLLQLSRSSRGKLTHGRVDLAGIVEELGEQLQRDDDETPVELEVRGKLDVSGDPRLLRTLMQNLLENAWKYQRNGIRTRIQVYREVIEGTDYICVEDNGVGFNPEYGHKLFEPFQRLHRQDEFSGIGIGLATCARIARRHGGDIAGCGRPGEGACFCFTLPR